MTGPRMSRRAALGAAVGASLVAVGACRRDKGEATIAAAASLRLVFPDLVSAFSRARPGAAVVATFGASGDLAKEVEAGAPIDGVLFASDKPVDRLVKAGRVAAESRTVVAENRLVLIAPRPRAGETAPKLTFETIDTLPPGERIAVGDPGAVPAGQYAKEALEKLGRWQLVKDRLVLGADVSAVLAYTRRGEVGAAIVYETELHGIDDVVLLDRARAPWAPRALVVGGVVRDAREAHRAGELLSFLTAPEGRAILVGFGFEAPG